MEKRLLGKDGRYRWFLVRCNPVLNDDGEVVRWFGTATDIEDRKQAENRVRNENVALREEIEHSSMFEEIVGSSESLRRVLGQVSKVAPTDSTVLVSGETGTGKELIARAIHSRSNRSTRAFIRVNCAAMSPSLIASELFGHERVPSRGRISDVSDALNRPTAERFFWMRLVRYRQRRKLLCYEFSRSTNSSEWVGTKRFRLMCECSRRQIRIYAPPWLMARSVRICFTGSMFSRFKCRDFVIALMTSRC